MMTDHGPTVTCGQCGEPDVLLVSVNGSTRGQCRHCGTCYEHVVVHGSDAELASVVRERLLRRLEPNAREGTNPRYRFVKGTDIGVLVRGRTEAQLLSGLLEALLLEVETR